jgi:hypothetical protein
MKLATIVKTTVLFLILLSRYEAIYGQGNWANTYIVAYKDTCYKFEINVSSNSSLIKYYHDTSGFDTIRISSMDDGESFCNMIKNIIKNQTNFSSSDKKEIANKLFVAYKARQQTEQLFKRINTLENDGRKTIGIISLKRPIVNAKLFSRRKLDKILFYLEKERVVKEFRHYKDSIMLLVLDYNKNIDKVKDNEIDDSKYIDLGSRLNLYKRTINDTLSKSKKDTLQKLIDLCNDSIQRLKRRTIDSLMSQVNRYKALIQNRENIDGIFFQPSKGIKYFYQRKRSFRKRPDLIKYETVRLNIDSVDISFENGIIKDIHVRTRLYLKHNKVRDSIFYFSNWGYIPIRNAQDIDGLSCKGKNYVSFLYSNDSIMVLDLADVINYDRKISFSSGTYIPKDTTVVITNGKNEIVRLYKPTISENFDISIYTDALGYSGTTVPNGIVQAEVQLDFNLNQGKNSYALYDIWRKSDKIKNKPIYRYQLVVLNKISPYFKLTKIEKSNNRLTISDTTKGDMMNVFKYSHLNIGTELNLLTYRTDSKLFTINTAGGILRTTIGNDSIESNNKDISTLYFYPNLELKFFDSNKIDFSLRFGAYGAWNVNGIDTASLSKAKVKIKNKYEIANNCWAQFQQSINLHPGGNKQSSIFIRSAQYVGTKSNYYTFQIGYSTSLGNVLNF